MIQERADRGTPVQVSKSCFGCGTRNTPHNPPRSHPRIYPTSPSSIGVLPPILLFIKRDDSYIIFIRLIS